MSCFSCPARLALHRLISNPLPCVCTVVCAVYYKLSGILLVSEQSYYLYREESPRALDVCAGCIRISMRRDNALMWKHIPGYVRYTAVRMMLFASASLRAATICPGPTGIIHRTGQETRTKTGSGWKSCLMPAGMGAFRTAAVSS